jgi:hypothetical protein
MSIVEKMSNGLDAAATEIMLLREQLEREQKKNRKFREALERIALCDWIDTTYKLREIAKEALE